MSSDYVPSARELLRLLRQRDLLPEDVLSRWEQEIARATKPLSARWLAKRLVELDYLTEILAERLIRELTDRASGKKPAASTAGRPPLSESPSAVTDDVDIAIVDEEIPISRQSGAIQVVAPPVEPALPARPPISGKSEVETPSRHARSGRISSDEEAEEEPVVLLPRRRRNVWESPLFLLGGGALILLTLIMIYLLWAVRRQGADQLFALAEEDYRSGSYTQAIAKFNEFLDKFPRHPRAPIARVHRGLARIRQAVDSGRDWVENLHLAQQILGDISGEEVFREEARGELIALLPRIAQELAKRALQQLDPQLVDKTQEAVDLVNKYLSPADRPAAILNDVEASIAIARYRLSAGDRLRQILSDIDQALAERQTERAYGLRRDLLRDHPQLAADPAVGELGRKIAAVEGQLVSMLPGDGEVSQSDWPRSAEHILLACRSETSPAPVSPHEVVCALHQGVAFGLDAQSGKVLWRRVVGEHLTAGRLPAVPLRLESTGQNDFLLVDSWHQELLRLDAQTGKLRWRLQLRQPPATQPVIAQGHIWVIFESGELLEIDPATGHVQRRFRFPQRLRVPPAVDDAGRWLFQLGEHSTLFVVDLKQGKCVDAIFIGHEPGASLLPPVMVGSYLLVTVQSGIKQSDIHIFSVGSEENKPLEARAVMRLPVQVALPPLVSGSRVFVASHEGPAWVYEVAAGQPGNPLQEIAKGNLGTAERQVGSAEKRLFARFGIFEGSQVWIADYQLTCYDVLPLKASLQPKAIRSEASVAVQPLVTIGPCLYHIRKVWGLPDLVVSAFSVSDAQLLWETRLSVPLAAEPIPAPDGKTMICVTRTGSLFRLSVDELAQSAIINEPYITLKLAELQQPIQAAIPAGEGMVVLVLAEGSPRLPVYDPAEPVARFRWILLSSPLSGPVSALEPGIIVGTEAGQLLWLHPRDGRLLADPFVHPEPQGTPVRWMQAWPLGKEELVVGDRSGRLFRLRVYPQPKAHFRLEAEAVWSSPFASPLALCGNTVWVQDRKGTLAGFSLPQLESIAQLNLGEEAMWGPVCVDKYVLIATSSEIVCVEASGQVAWRVAAERGIPVGRPWREENACILSTRNRWVLKVDLASGQVLAAKELEAPLATGPIRLHDRWFAGGSDGCVYLFTLP